MEDIKQKVEGREFHRAGMAVLKNLSPMDDWQIGIRRPQCIGTSIGKEFSEIVRGEAM